MPEYLHPGVYVEEVPSGVRPIEGVGTSTAAFLGETQRGPVGEARFLTNWQEFVNTYGGFYNKLMLPYSVYAFFNNGGKKCYVVRIVGSGAGRADITLRDSKDDYRLNSIYQREDVLKIIASSPGSAANPEPVNSPGEWGNDIDIDILEATLDPVNRFKLRVKMEGQILETFDELSMDDTDANYVVDVINGESKFIRVEVLNPQTQTRGALVGGTVIAPSVVSGSTDLNVSLDGSSPPQNITLTARTDGEAIAADIRDNVRAAFPGTIEGDNFECYFVDDRFVLLSGSRGEGSEVIAANGTAGTVAEDLLLDAANATQIDGTNLRGTSTSDDSPETDLSAVTSPLKLQIALDGEEAREITLAASGLTNGINIATAIQAAVTALSANDPQNQDAYDNFTCAFTSGRYVLTSGTHEDRLIRSSVVVTDGTEGNLAGLLKLGTVHGGSEIKTAAYLRPVEGTSYHVGDDPRGALVGSAVAADVTAGVDGNTPGATDYTNPHFNAKAEDSALNQLNDISIIAAPGAVGDKSVNADAINYCSQRKDCVFIADMTEVEDTPTEARHYVQTLTTKNSYGAIYFPWIRIADADSKARGKNPTILVPPSGFMAGIYARTDGNRGVFKAPAGTAVGVGGALELVYNVTDEKQDILNPHGVNCIRQFPASGIVVWGARTLGTESDPEWRYIPVRRYAIYLEWSIYRGIQWAVFEPNDEPLWNSLRSNIEDFMMGEFRKGALQGSKPGDAFYVKCDAELNPQSEIDAGRVNVEVAFAPLKPAEFVIIRISQKTQRPS